VILHLSDGRTLRHREAVNRGCAERPLSDAEIVDKFHDNASYVRPGGGLAALRDAVLNLDAAPARALEDALAFA